MAMIEVSQAETAAAPPPPTFSAPFAAPDLRWARKKRLRCFNLEAFHSLHSEIDPPDDDVEVMGAVSPKGEERESSSRAGEIAGRLLRSRTREESAKNSKKVELWVPLSKQEIDEDFLRMTKSKPPRRCKRRGNSSNDQLSVRHLIFFSGIAIFLLKFDVLVFSL